MRDGWAQGLGAGHRLVGWLCLSVSAPTSLPACPSGNGRRGGPGDAGPRGGGVEVGVAAGGAGAGAAGGKARPGRRRGRRAP